MLTSLTSGSETILLGVLYDPFGPIRGWTWGNASQTVRTYDLDGNLDLLDSGGLKTYAQDDAFRITGISDAVDPDLSWNYGYDLLDRLTGASRAGLSQGWTYDGNGNRLSQTGTAASTYSMSGSSNRLNGVSGALSRSYGYDAAGNAIADGTASFSYDDSGHLLGEYAANGALIREYVWLGDIPVAVITGGPGTPPYVFWYIHADHLNTPRSVENPTTGELVWRWDSAPFGETAPNEDPDGDLEPFTLPLRFPGQYADQETGLNYNYFRDYEPATGRYVESDPMGLDAGINTYSYVLSRPTSHVDVDGLEAVAEMQRQGWGLESAKDRAEQRCAWDAFRRNYAAMKMANTIGADRYFHCKANCEAARCGPKGFPEACMISDLREFSDHYIKHPARRLIGRPDSPTYDASSKDSAQDQAANHHGRNGARNSPTQSCPSICSSYRPNGLSASF